MRVNISVSDVLGIARELEDLAFEYYSTIATRSFTTPAGALFNRLAEDERGHSELVVSLLGSIKSGAHPDHTPGDDEAYFRSVATEGVGYRERIATVLADEAPLDMNQALLLAMEMERAGMRFYSTLSKLLRPKEARKIQSLIEQEQSHHDAIERLLGQIESQTDVHQN